MAWIVGVDEAGYGPNLGPFVMCSVAWRVPDDRVADDGVDFWGLLPAVLCKGDGKANGRLVVDDSKVVHGKRGLAGLERGVLGLLHAATPATLADLLRPACRDGVDDLAAEAWYTGASAVPTETVDDLDALRATLADAFAAVEVTPGPWHCLLVCPARFNDLADAAGTKGAVLAHALQRLLAEVPDLPGDEPVYLFVDKHGGRNNYAAFVQHAFGQGMVVARQESAARSVYDVLGLPRKVRLCFQPRADAGHATVALASMAAKYLRERLMGEFNAFFQKHLPDLAPTAGYPGDAARFFAAIQPLLASLNLSPERLWRKK